ncbi:MAG: DUF1853 family protein [Motiliproteus sp.]|nr:DUF1853 family protein [Motiliproteus sp.]MCW9053920.1 DUF1853 family protein [Motiliproteus sp.]
MTWQPPFAPHNRAVSDLAWVLLSPPLCLFAKQQFTPPQPRSKLVSWLQHIDEEPESLFSYLDSVSNSDHRLGRHFENLLGYYLKQICHKGDLTRGLRVEDTRTLGEFDFLYRPKTSTNHIHLEVAVKFYLGTAEQSLAENWIGPNPEDSLAAKLYKTFDSQLKLSQHSAAKAQLCSHQISVDATQALLCGKLFYPWKQFLAGQFQHPSIVNPDHQKGWWAREDDCDWLAESNYSYQPLDKRHWLAELTSPEIHTVRVEEVLAHAQNRPLMVARVDKQNGAWKEIDRGVITPRNWPN